ncbi:AAA family ATPase, partial [bacterium]|nr:AAA family ATPase [bacterium]
MSNNSNVNIVEREVFNHILPWIKEKEIIAINGPRQAGKTTLINKIKESLPADSVVYISFENNQSLSSFITSPKEFVLAYLQNK